MSFGWFAHGWNVSSGAVLALWSWCCADENVCNAGALLGFEVTSHHGLLLSGSRHESSGQAVLSGCLEWYRVVV